MASHTIQSLRSTLKALRQRRRNLVLLSFASQYLVLVCLVLGTGLGLAYFGEPGRNASIALFTLLLALLAAATSWFWLRLRRGEADDRRLAHYVEDHIPDLEQRLLTSLEFSDEELKSGRAGVSKQFIEQLWEDAEQHVREQQRQVETVMPAQASLAQAGFAAVVVAVSTALLFSSESLWQSANRLAWPFAIEVPVLVENQSLPIEISVEPGDVEMQRGESLTIVARIRNGAGGNVTLRVQDDRVNWQDYSMNPETSLGDDGGASYSYFLPSVSEDASYYVSLGDDESSPQYRISLFDLPQIERIDLAFDYPDYTALDDLTEEDSGDIVVPVGTVVNFEVEFNKPLQSALVEMESNPDVDEEAGEVAPEPYANLGLTLSDNKGYGFFTVTQDGLYRIRATDLGGLTNPNPLDYYIRAIPDRAPELTLRRPGRDQEVMPLEEVVLEVDASDDYGLSDFRLNYSVVGKDEVQVDFLQQPNTRSVSGEELIYLEDLGVEPGDFVSYYLTLADNNGLSGPQEVISDIYFLQVIPTDQEFRRSSSGGSGGQGAGGGQGGDSSALVTVQKDIIAATWKLRNRASQVSSDELAGDAEIIAESQRGATERARMSIDRLAERLTFSDESYDNAVENLSLAIEQMNLAAAELDVQQVTSALRPEQAALQYILKAEAAINRTDISMQQGGGGGGGGQAQQEREDLRELFEMEMGQLENRYETPNSPGGRNQQNAEEADKLEELARRQEGITRAQRNLARREDQMTEEQRRRELERLMRQQEQLSQEVQQLAQQMSRSQQRGQSAQSQQSAQSGGSSSEQSESALQRAAQQMQEAAQSDSPSIAAARSQKALENLRQQQRQMEQDANSSVNQLAQSLGQRGQQLLQQQRELQDALQEAVREQGLGQTRLEARNDERLDAITEAQQRQQRSLEEIEEMLRAVIARGDSDDQRLLAQAQAATRELQPIEEEMRTSARVLRNGMVNLAVDIEQELEEPLQQLAASLAALDPSQAGNESDRVQQAASDAEALREQIEELERQVQQFNAARGEPGAGGQSGEAPSVGELREQLARSQQLAQQLNQQVQQQSQQGGQQAGGRQIGGRQQRGSQQDGQPGQQQGGQARTDGNNSAIGNARSIRQQITRQDIEDFLNQPELFRELLQPIVELEAALRAQAELDNISTKLYSTSDEEVPEEYRELVEEYYRVLSESQGTNSSR